MNSGHICLFNVAYMSYKKMLYARLCKCAGRHTEKKDKSGGAQIFCAPPLYLNNARLYFLWNPVAFKNPAGIPNILFVFQTVAVFAGSHVFNFFECFQERADFVIT